MESACRIHRTPALVGWSRTRCPIQNPRIGDHGIGPHLIGVGSDLLEHIEIVLTARCPHPLEDADVATRQPPASGSSGAIGAIWSFMRAKISCFSLDRHRILARCRRPLPLSSDTSSDLE